VKPQTKKIRTYTAVFFLSILLVFVGVFLSFGKKSFAAGHKLFPGLPNSAHQRSILFVVIDRLDSPSPALRSAWLIIHLPSSKTVTLLPIFPALSRNSDAEDVKLQTTFFLNDDGSPSNIFLNEISVMDIRYEEYLVLDELALGGLVKLLNGIKLGYEYFDSKAIEDGLYLSNLDSGNQLIYQAELLAEICHSIPLLSIHPDLDKALSNLIMHSTGSMSLAEIQQTIYQLTRSESAISCDFPSINPMVLSSILIMR
jgi:hypothetical protein